MGTSCFCKERSFSETLIFGKKVRLHQTHDIVPVITTTTNNENNNNTLYFCSKWSLSSFMWEFEAEIKTFKCALWNEAKVKSQKEGKQLSKVGNSHCCGEVHGILPFFSGNLRSILTFMTEREA